MMEMLKYGPFPSDLPHWPQMKKLLGEIASPGTSASINVFVQKLFQLLAENNHTIDKNDPDSTTTVSCKASLVMETLLDALDCTNNSVDSNEDVIRYIADRAACLEDFLHGFHHYKLSEGKQCYELTRQLVLSFVSYLLLCALPPVVNSCDMLCNFSFLELFAHRNSVNVARMRYILKYISGMSRPNNGPDGTITFTRLLVAEPVEVMELITNEAELCRIDVHSANLLQNETGQMLQVFVGTGTFANRSVLESSDEMIPMCVYPELIASQLFMAPAEINELIYVHSAQSMASTSATDRVLEICFIDTALSPFQSQNNLYNFASITREVASLVAAFQCDECGLQSSSSSAENQLVPNSASSDTNADVSSSDQNSVVQLHSVTGHVRKAAYSGLRTKCWRSSSSAGSFSASFSRGQSVDFDTSSSSSAGCDDMPPGITVLPRRRSSALHCLAGAPSRRGSGIQGQSSVNSDAFASEFGSYTRRRSSGLSDVSLRSSSSSGKRSSTDFSSEVDENFDNLPQHRSLAAAVIEEENGVTHETTVTVLSSHMDTISEDMSKEPFSCSESFRALDSPGPCNHQQRHLQSHISLPGQNVLEHFVDNLINQATQDSRIELESYHLHQQHLLPEILAPPSRTERQVPSFSAADSSNFCSQFSADTNYDVDESIFSCYCEYANILTHDIVSSALGTVTDSSQLGSSVTFATSKDLSPSDFSDTSAEHVLDNYAKFLSEVICRAALEAYCNIAGINANVMNKETESALTELPSQSLLQIKRAGEPRNAGEEKTQSRADFQQGSSCLKYSKLGIQKCSRSQQELLSHQETPYVSHFKDSVWSNFEEELIKSSVTNSELVLFVDVKRRSSEPAVLPHSGKYSGETRRRNRQLTSVSFCTSELQQRLPLSDYDDSIRATVLRWFADDAVDHRSDDMLNDVCRYSENLVIDVFFYALTEICTPEAVHHNRSSSAYVDDSQDIVTLSQFIVKRALHEASDIVSASSQANMMHPGRDIDEVNCQLRAKSVSTTELAPLQRRVAGGRSGPMSSYYEDQQLSAMIQWIAASVAHVTEFVFYTSNDVCLNQMKQVVTVIIQRHLTVSVLINEIRNWCSMKQVSLTDTVSLFDYIMQRLA